MRKPIPFRQFVANLDPLSAIVFLMSAMLLMIFVAVRVSAPKEEEVFNPRFKIGECLQRKGQDYWENVDTFIILEIGQHNYRVAKFDTAIDVYSKVSVPFNTENNYEKVSCNSQN